MAYYVNLDVFENWVILKMQWTRSCPNGFNSWMRKEGGCAAIPWNKAIISTPAPQYGAKHGIFVLNAVVFVLAAEELRWLHRRGNSISCLALWHSGARLMDSRLEAAISLTSDLTICSPPWTTRKQT